jgi:hypothetical protein
VPGGIAVEREYVGESVAFSGEASQFENGLVVWGELG